MMKNAKKKATRDAKLAPKKKRPTEPKGEDFLFIPESFVLAKAKEWECSPDEAWEHLVNPESIRNPHKESPADFRSLTVSLSAAHLEEVESLLPRIPGLHSTIAEAAEAHMRQWLCNLISTYGDPFTARPATRSKI